jgi:hypothetical protein
VDANSGSQALQHIGTEYSRLVDELCFDVRLGHSSAYNVHMVVQGDATVHSEWGPEAGAGREEYR